MRALIAGCGIGGLSAAIALGKQGIDVHLVEKRTDNLIYGVGLNNPPNSLRALDRLGVLEECLAIGAPLQGFNQYDMRGNKVGVYLPPVPTDGMPAGCALPRPELHRILLDAAQSTGTVIEYGKWIADFTEVDDLVKVEFSDGTRGEYDVVAGFDGIRSTLRASLFGEAFKPAYTGYSVWRKTMARPPGLDFTEAFIGSRTKASVILLTEETMYLLVVSVEPEGWHPPKEDLHTLLAERLEGFGGLIGDIRDTELSSPEGIVFSPLEEVILPLPWSSGRVIVLGDAAHAFTPHLTQGAGMALEDAVVLGDELTPGRHATVDEALRAVGERRFARVRYVQEVSHELLTTEMNGDEDQRLSAHGLVRQRQAEVAELLAEPA